MYTFFCPITCCTGFRAEMRCQSFSVQNCSALTTWQNEVERRWNATILEVGAVICKRRRCSQTTNSVNHELSAARDRLCRLLCMNRKSRLRFVQKCRVKFEKVGVQFFFKKIELHFLDQKLNLGFFKIDVAQLHRTLSLKSKGTSPEPCTVLITVHSGFAKLAVPSFLFL